MSTALAPMLSALMTSLPRRIPPSRRTSQRPSTAATTSGSARKRGIYAVELSTAMVGDDHSVHAGIDGPPGVLAGEDTLHEDLTVPAVANPGEVLPR